MTQDSNKESCPFTPAIFNGLSEKDLVPVYTIGKIKKLKSGEVLIKEGDSDHTVYVILDGSLKIVKEVRGKPEEITRLSRGDCMGEIAFARDTKRTASAVALENSNVMALDEFGLNALPHQTRSVIYKNLNDLAAKRIEALSADLDSLSEKNRYLTSRIRTSLKERNARYSGSEMIMNILKSFPRLPMYATRLTAMLLEKNVSTNEIVEYAKTDPSLVSVVLKTANSPYYNMAKNVADFQHAVLLLGFNQIYQIIVDNGIFNIMPDTGEFRELRTHSLLISTIGFEAALACNLNNPLLMNTLGMLHDIGKSVILLLKKDYPNIAVLLDMLDHEKIGSLLMKEWSLPESVHLAMEYQHYPEFAPPEEIPAEHRKSAALLHISHICSDCLQGRGGETTHTPFLEEYMHVLNFKGSPAELTDSRIVPALNKKLSSLPSPVRNILTNHR